MEDTIKNINTNTSHVFFAHNSFFGCPLPSTFHWFSKFTKILYTWCFFSKDVTTSIIRTKTPNLKSIIFVPFEFFTEKLGSWFNIILSRDSTFFNIISKINVKWSSLSIDSVMFIGWLGHANNTWCSSNSFLECDDGVWFNNFTVSKIFFKIIKTNFNMEFTASSNNVLTWFFNGTNNQWIWFREFLKTIYKFREILGIFSLNSNSNDGRDRVLHTSNSVSINMISDGTSFHDVLINTNKTNSVTTWDISNIFNSSTHHQNCSLDSFFIKVFLLSWFIIWSKDSNLLSSWNSTREDTSKSEESTSISCGDHLWYKHNQRTLRVAFSHWFSYGVILRTFVQVWSSVLLGFSWWG